MQTNPQLNLELAPPDRPSELIAWTDEEFSKICARADQLESVDGNWRVSKRGDYHIEWWSVVPGHNAAWKFKVKWH